METEHLTTSLTMLALVWAAGATVALILSGARRSTFNWLYLIASYSSLAAVLWIDSLTTLGRNSAVYLAEVLSSGEPRHLCAAGLGLSIGMGPACWPWLYRPRHSNGLSATIGSVALASISLTFLFIGLLALQEQVKPYLVHRDLVSVLASPLRNSPSGLLVEEFHRCEFSPVQIAASQDGSIYATGYRGLALQEGVVVRITADSTRRSRARTVARNLGRPHGLAVRDGDLYVSRSGQFARAESGTMSFAKTGAVTLLRDLDGDGVMDFYHDVVTDLPGAQGPDPLHQNNGIAFDDYGNLFVTVGRHSDRGPATGELEGTILRCHEDGSPPEVFASGLRNPFDVVIGPDGALFCTDNDSNDRRSGDELNHVAPGAHYGFPYTHGSDLEVDDATAPILVRNRGSLQGLTYATSSRLPAEFRNCLYVVSYGNGEILRINLRRDGRSYTAVPTVCARVPGAVDITVDRAGNFYVSCFETRRIYRLTYRRQET